MYIYVHMHIWTVYLNPLPLTKVKPSTSIKHTGIFTFEVRMYIFMYFKELILKKPLAINQKLNI